MLNKAYTSPRASGESDKEASRKVTEIEICFPCAVGITKTQENILDRWVSMICSDYEEDNPERIMWVASKNLTPLPGEPAVDNNVLVINMNDCLDLYGRNLYNPKRLELRKKRKSTLAAKQKALIALDKDYTSPRQHPHQTVEISDVWPANNKVRQAQYKRKKAMLRIDRSLTFPITLFR